MLNLLKNAAAAAKRSAAPQALVAVELHPTNASLVLSVSDNGPILTDAQFKALSEPAANLMGEGLGLGLNLCRSIAEHHDIKIAFERHADRHGANASGITVTVLFPKERLS